jgi:hypothetical protein
MSVESDLRQQEGIIKPAPDAPFTFTDDRWVGSWLWRYGDEVWCSMLMARQPGQGHFRELVDAIEAEGLRVAVPIPMGKMPDILTHMGFVEGWSLDPDGVHGLMEVWRRVS